MRILFEVSLLNKAPAERIAFLSILALLLIAFALGGGGSRQGLANLFVQLTALAVLAPHRTAFFRFWGEATFALRALICVSLLLPLIQIVPLPPGVWRALPGRDLVIQSLETVGETGWMTLSVNPLRTLLALTALATPLAVLVAGWLLPRHHLFLLGWLVVALGLVTSLLGVSQLGSTGDDGTLFGARNPGTALLGTFANRNSTGLFIGIALALAAVLPAPGPHPAIVLVRVALCAVLLLAIVLTGSRSALFLAALPLALAGFKALRWSLDHRSAAQHSGGNRHLFAIALGAIALVAAGGAALIVVAPGPIGDTMERFGAKDDPRRYIWDDASYTAARYWPIGAGMGTFDEVFQVDESLENLTQRKAGRAHSDYLELTIEAGLPGLILAAMWLGLIGWLSWRARHSLLRWVAWAGSAFLFAIALQSITDYPLRNQTILAFAGFALLVLARGAADHAKARP